MISTKERSLVWFSLGLTIGYLLESTNLESELPGMLLGAPPGLWFGSDAVMWRCCWRLTGCRKATLWGVDIYWVPPYGALITSNMKSVRYWQLLEFLNFSLSPTWLIPSTGERQIFSELASSGSMPFTLVMYDDSSRLTSEPLSLSNLLGTLVGWDSPSHGVRVKLLQ